VLVEEHAGSGNHANAEAGEREEGGGGALEEEAAQ
jgi:hypothetical protein